MAKYGLLLLLAVAGFGMVTSKSYALQLEAPRVLDEQYQEDRAEYTEKIRQLRYLLSVRAKAAEKKVLLGARIYILNLGRAEAYTKGDAVYIDMGLLDLLSQFADELSLADVKHDALHQMEFNLVYAAALNGDKQLPLLDAMNTVALTEDQNLYLWKAKLRSEHIIFDNLLGFVLAHEFSHLILRHRERIANEFPEEGSRTTANPAWNRARRTMELEADEAAARLCLNALIQPAQLVAWLDLNETRRRYYGVSAEYPTSAQRIAVLQRVHEEIVGKSDLGPDLRNFIPLPPGQNVTQTDYLMYLSEFRKVRQYRQTLLVSIDREVLDLLAKGDTTDEALAVFIAYVEQQKDLLRGAKNKEALAELKASFPPGAASPSRPAAEISELIKNAGIGPYAETWLLGLLQADTPDWSQIGPAIELLEGDRSQFLLGIDYEYLLANTVLRWDPEIFARLQAMLPDTEVKARSLKPYVLDRPLYPDRPSFTERIEVLRQWNGVYPKGTDTNQASAGN